MKLSANGIKILKLLHLVFASSWLGGALSIMILYFTKLGVENADIIVGVNTASRWIDNGIVVVLGACGCFFTGLVYSLFTNWGFYKHKWILIKWILTISSIAIGTTFLGPWENQMLEMSRQLGSAIFNDAEYIKLTNLHFGLGIFQVSTILFMLYLSVFKPFKKSKNQ